LNISADCPSSIRQEKKRTSAISLSTARRFAHYDRCVNIEQEAEGKVSDDEHLHLRRNTKNAFDEK
jgi:hypothetical protein